MRERLPKWLVQAPFAHRGLHDLAAGAPENTLAAFSAAVDAGYGIELDVQQLGDGSLVVFHDDDLVRACGETTSLLELGSAELSSRRVFGSSEAIPSLEGVLAHIAGRVPILLEIKQRGNHTDIARAVEAALRPYAGPVAIQSFNPFVLAWFRKHAGALPRGQLGGALDGYRASLVTKLAQRRLFTLALSQAHFVNYELSALPDAYIQGLTRALRLPLLCWTVRSENDRQKAERLGCNYVFDHIRP